MTFDRLRKHRTGALWGLAAVCVLGFTARLLFAAVLVPSLERHANVVSDPDHYVELATSLIDRGELGFVSPGWSPTSVRGPGFPVWLAIGMLVGGRSEGWVALWACVPGLLAALTIAIVLGRSHGRIAGLAGGLLCAAHPLACFVSARALPDEFYGAALLVGLVAWQRSLRSVRTPHLLGWAALSGVLLCAASLTRVTALGILIVLAAIALLIRPRQLLSCAVVALVAAGLLGPWIWRTSALVGRPTFVETLTGYNFWLGEASFRYEFAPDFGQARRRAHELMATEAGTPETRSPSFWYATLSPRDARAFDDKLIDAGLRRIRNRPWSYGTRCAVGLLWFWIRAETASRTMQYALAALPLVALSLVGLWRVRAYPEQGALPAELVAGIVFAHVVIYAAICPMARYSVQVYPLMCYLAGAAFTHGGRKLVDRDRRN